MKVRTTDLPKKAFIFEDDSLEVKRSKRYINTIITLRKAARNGHMAWDRTVGRTSGGR